MDKRKSKKYLDKFERTKLIGIRAEELSKLCNPMVSHTNDNLLEIAEKELRMGKLGNYIIARPLHDGTVEYFKVSELIQFQ